MAYMARAAMVSLLAFIVATLVCSATKPALAQSQPGGRVEVELELVLAVDTSASVDNAEFKLQMGGIADAFRHPEVVAAIAAHGQRGIAVTLVQWSAGDQQAQSVGWHHIFDVAGAAALARAIEAAPRLFAINTTAIGSALRYCARLFAGNRFSGRRWTIDVSGDGRSNAGLSPRAERDRAVSQGITINGLTILNGHLELERYYRVNVIGGPQAFVEKAEDFADFARAIRHKLVREIAPIVAFKTNPERYYSAQVQLSSNAPLR